MKILYEDAYLLIAEKPAGMLSLPDETGDEDLLTLLRERQRENGDRFAAQAVHRLDRGTGGAILFAKGAGVASELSTLLRERKTEKQYLAAVTGIPTPAEGRWEDDLVHKSASNRTEKASKNDPSARSASLRYRILSTADDALGRPASLLLVTLETGRTHQIRAQAALRGHPLLGDGKYGGPGGCPLGLWSYRISFSHPRKKGVTVSAVSEPPAGVPWSFFPASAGIDKHSAGSYNIGE